MAYLYVILLRETAKKSNFIFLKFWDSRNREISGEKNISLPILKAGRSDDLMMVNLSAWLCSQTKKEHSR